MNKEITNTVIKILSGEASKDEMQGLLKWIGDDEKNLNEIRRIETIWNASGIIVSKDSYDKQEAFARFKTLAMERPANKAAVRIRTIDRLLRIAAILILVSGLLFLFFNRDRENQVAGSDLCTIISPAGSKAQVILPDGTKVWLNADSKIDYRFNPGNNTREVNLEGEGFFEVAKDTSRPFVVNTADIRIKALGTSFNVKAYADDGIIVATLIEGKVVMEKTKGKNSRELIILEPEQEAVVYRKEFKESGQKKSGDVKAEESRSSNAYPEKIVLREKVNTGLTTAWKDNYLYFDDETFRNLAIKLERRFGVTIEFRDKEIEEYRFRGKFDDVIIEQVLAALQYASEFEYLIKDNRIILYNGSKKPE